MWAVVKRKDNARDLPPGERVELVRHEGVPSIEELGEAVGGWPTGFALARSSNGRTIRGWVEDTGLLDGLPPTVTRDGTDDGVLVGPVVITGCNAGGNDVPLTESELGRVHVGPEALISFRFGELIPILTIEEA